MSEADGFAIAFAPAARRDLRDIARYMAGVRDREDAEALIAAITERIMTLRTYPHRGAVPKELHGMEGRGFRQLIFRHYRIVYAVVAKTVVVLLITDGRRDMRALLRERGLAPDPPA